MPAILAVDLKGGKAAFTPHNTFTIEEADDHVTEQYLHNLAQEISSRMSEDIGATVIIRSHTFAMNNRTYLQNELEDIGLVDVRYIRYETAFIIGALERTQTTITDGQTIAVFYKHNENYFGDLWRKEEDGLVFDKRIFYSGTVGGMNKAFTTIPNHILVSSAIESGDRLFANMNATGFDGDNNFLLCAGLVKAQIVRNEERYLKYNAVDIGDKEIAAPTKKVAPKSVIGISIGTDTFAVAKFANQVTEIVKNKNNQETTNCLVAVHKNLPLTLAGDDQTDVEVLTHCIELLGIKENKVGQEPYKDLNLSFNDEAINTKMSYVAQGKIINPERAVSTILNTIKTMADDDQAAIVFALSSEIKDDPQKLRLFLDLAKNAGLANPKIVDNDLALCLGGSQASDKKDNGTFVGIRVADKKVDAILFTFINGQIDTFHEASRDLPPANTNNREFVASLREHLLVICKACFDVLKAATIDRSDVDVILLNYASGRFRETTKEFLARMFPEKVITELQTSRTVNALGSAIYGAIAK